MMNYCRDDQANRIASLPSQAKRQHIRPVIEFFGVVAHHILGFLANVGMIL